MTDQTDHTEPMQAASPDAAFSVSDKTTQPTKANRETGKANAEAEFQTLGQYAAALDAAWRLDVICERHRVMRWGKRKEAK